MRTQQLFLDLCQDTANNANGTPEAAFILVLSVFFGFILFLKARFSGSAG